MFILARFYLSRKPGFMKTPQQSYPKLAKAVGVPELYLKREDLHKYGSHKGRSIPLMIKEYAKQGYASFAVSSSGNAALAAVRATIKHNQNNPKNPITLSVLIGERIRKEKKDILEKEINGNSSLTLEQMPRPKQEGMTREKEQKAKYLRQSVDDLALVGYMELAEELNKLPGLSAIFIPTSSGTTAQGLGEAFLSALSEKPEIHIVQTDSCHPMVGEKTFEEHTPPSLADAIVDIVGHRKKVVLDIIKKTNGGRWVADNAALEEAKKIVKETSGIDISYNSALSIAGLRQAVAQGEKFFGPVVCLITGK